MHSKAIWNPENNSPIELDIYKKSILEQIPVVIDNFQQGLIVHITL